MADRDIDEAVDGSPRPKEESEGLVETGTEDFFGRSSAAVAAMFEIDRDSFEAARGILLGGGMLEYEAVGFGSPAGEKLS